MTHSGSPSWTATRPPPGESGNRPRRRARIHPLSIGAVFLCVMVLLIWLVGGWERAENHQEQQIPAALVGELVSVAPFEVAVQRAFWTVERKPHLFSNDGERWLILQLEVTNATTFPASQTVLLTSTYLNDVVTNRNPGEEGLPEGRPARAIRANDSLYTGYIQPNLTQSMLVAWRQSVSEPLPQNLNVTLSRHTRREHFVTLAMGWLDPEPAYTVTVPLKQEEGA